MGPFLDKPAQKHEDSREHTLRMRVQQAHRRRDLFPPPSQPLHPLSSPELEYEDHRNRQDSPSNHDQPLHGPCLPTDDGQYLIFDDFDENYEPDPYEDDPVVGLNGAMYDAFSQVGESSGDDSDGFLFGDDLDSINDLDVDADSDSAMSDNVDHRVRRGSERPSVSPPADGMASSMCGPTLILTLILIAEEGRWAPFKDKQASVGLWVNSRVVNQFSICRTACLVLWRDSLVQCGRSQSRMSFVGCLSSTTLTALGHRARMVGASVKSCSALARIRYLTRARRATHSRITRSQKL